MKRYCAVLTIAGSDPSGGAGIQADLKTISALGCYGMAAVTAVTVQNTQGVSAVSPVPPDIVEGQIQAVCSDIPPLAIKIGMLNDAPTVMAVYRALSRFLDYRPATPVVIDPVMFSTSGAQLLDDEAIELMCRKLFPLAAIVTPNVTETQRLTGGAEKIEDQRIIAELFHSQSYLLKGGDRETGAEKTDYLITRNDAGIAVTPLSASAVATVNTHGTGCTLSAAIASFLALGHDIVSAVTMAKRYVTGALAAGAEVTTGHGHGPLNHFYSPKSLRIHESEDKQ